MNDWIAFAVYCLCIVVGFALLVGFMTWVWNYAEERALIDADSDALPTDLATVEDFIPQTEDVRAAELDLPEMRDK